MNTLFGCDHRAAYSRIKWRKDDMLNSEGNNMWSGTTEICTSSLITDIWTLHIWFFHIFLWSNKSSWINLNVNSRLYYIWFISATMYCIQYTWGGLQYVVLNQFSTFKGQTTRELFVYVSFYSWFEVSYGSDVFQAEFVETQSRYVYVSHQVQHVSWNKLKSTLSMFIWAC